MEIQSFAFPVFFVMVMILLFNIPQKGRCFFLLGSSLFFYYFLNIYYLLILLASGTIDYFLGLNMKQWGQKHRKRLLIIGLCNNLLTLFLFKYFQFFTLSLNSLLSTFNVGFKVPLFKFLIPLGISYYTFKKISYLVEVYRGNIEIETHIGRFMLYVSFFPSLLAGPIDRPGKLLPQFKQKCSFDFNRMVEGVTQIVWGLFKKMVIADNLAPMVNNIFNNPHQFEGIHFILAASFFSIQIYCDFSGYSDMAIGSAWVMGIKLQDNFNRPYQAVSITDFWRRWHITLSSWLRDYLFLPISYFVSRKIKTAVWLGIRADKWAYLLGMTATMLLCGLWHGAGWTFIIWGGIHGTYISLAFLTRKQRAKIRKHLKIKKTFLLHHIFSIFLTFSFVSLTWIFFKAQTVSSAFYIISHFFSGIPQFFVSAASFLSHLTGQSFANFLINNQMGAIPLHLIFISLAIVFMFIVERRQKDKLNINAAIAGKPTWYRWSFYYILIFGILIFSGFEPKEFIYFKF